MKHWIGRSEFLRDISKGFRNVLSALKSSAMSLWRGDKEVHVTLDTSLNTVLALPCPTWSHEQLQALCDPGQADPCTSPASPWTFLCTILTLQCLSPLSVSNTGLVSFQHMLFIQFLLPGISFLFGLAESI